MASTPDDGERWDGDGGATDTPLSPASRVARDNQLLNDALLSVDGKRQAVPGNGDCQFEAVARQLEGCTAFDLRQAVVQHLQQHPPAYDEMFRTQGGPGDAGQTWNTYLENMKKPGTYGDHLTLAAMCDLKKLSVWTLSVSEAGCLALSHEGCGEDTCQKRLFLAYRPEHYDWFTVGESVANQISERELGMVDGQWAGSTPSLPPPPSGYAPNPLGAPSLNEPTAGEGATPTAPDPGRPPRLPSSPAIEGVVVVPEALAQRRPTPPHLPAGEAGTATREAAQATAKAVSKVLDVVAEVKRGVANAHDAKADCEAAAIATATAAAAARRAAVTLKNTVSADVIDAAAAVAYNNAAIDKVVTAAARARIIADAVADTVNEVRADVGNANAALEDADNAAREARHHAATWAWESEPHSDAYDPGKHGNVAWDTALAARSFSKDAARVCVDELDGVVAAVEGSAKAAAAYAEYAAVNAEIASKGKAVLVSQLMKYLQVRLERATASKTIIPYISFLVLFAVYMGFLYLSNQESAGLHGVNTALRKNLMEDDTFKEISTHDEFYDWLRATSKNFWVTKAEYDRAVAAAGTSVDGLRGNRTRTLLVGIDRVQTGNGLFAERQNYPLHFMMLRQRRVQTERCGGQQAAPLQAELWQRIENTCIDKLSLADDEGAYLRNRSHPFPALTAPNATTPPAAYTTVTTDPFLTDDQKEPRLPEMCKSRGRSRSYSNDDKLYSAKLPYQELFLGDVEKIVSDLKANDWIDFTTRVVVVETMVYNAVQHRYVVLRYVVEFTHSGRVTAFSTSEPFWLMFFDGGGWHIFAFICDLLFSLYFFFSLYLLWSRLFVSWLLGMENLALWKIWDSVYLLATGSLGVCLVYRFLIWGRSQSMADLSGTDLYEDMLSYQELFAWAKHWSTATFWLSFLRFYEYLTYAELCHLRVAEGIRLAAWDLFAIFILGIVITLGFGLVANVIYGWHLEDFDTYLGAVGWLQRLVFTGDFGNYDEMRDLEPVWTPVFLLVYIVITWFILMNVALGILIAGFEAASLSTREGVFWDTMLAQLRLKLKRWASIIAKRCSQCVPWAPAAGPPASPPAATSGVASAPSRASLAAVSALVEPSRQDSVGSGASMTLETSPDLREATRRFEEKLLAQAKPGPPPSPSLGAKRARDWSLFEKRVFCLKLLRGFLTAKEAEWRRNKGEEETFNVRTQVIIASELLELAGEESRSIFSKETETATVLWSDCFSEEKTKPLIEAAEDQMESLLEAEKQKGGLLQREVRSLVQAEKQKGDQLRREMQHVEKKLLTAVSEVRAELRAAKDTQSSMLNDVTAELRRMRDELRLLPTVARSRDPFASSGE